MLPSMQIFTPVGHSGAGVIVNVSGGVDAPPPGLGLETVTLAVPAVATSLALIAAVTSVELTNVVVRFDPFQRTTDEALKFVPVTSRVKAPVPATVCDGEMAVVVGTGLLTVNAALFPAASVPSVAVSTTPVSAFEYVTLIVTEFVPLRIVPERLRFPTRVPVPVLTLSVTPVSLVTFRALPLLSWAWTVTLKALPAVGVDGLIAVIASLLAGPMTVKFAPLVGVEVTTFPARSVPLLRETVAVPSPAPTV
jgi:hypothetical protein